jgi:uncharacterized protein YjbI with pentapeptide repeats
MGTMSGVMEGLRCFEVRAALAPVNPRVRLLPDGEPLPLVDVVRSMMRRGHKGIVYLTGAEGSGRTTALAHLMASIDRSSGIIALDGLAAGAAPCLSHWLVVVAAESARVVPRHDGVWGAEIEMCPWSDDDLIEYMLHTDRPRCASVMDRVLADASRRRLAGSPLLWREVLDVMRADDAVADTAIALRRAAFRHARGGEGAAEAGELCLRAALGDEQDRIALRRISRFAAHDAVRVLLAADALAYHICDVGELEALRKPWPAELVSEVAAQLAQRQVGFDLLADTAVGMDEGLHAMAVSLLVSGGADWKPDGRATPLLARACLSGAKWAGAELFRADLTEADLSHSDLSGARLSRASAAGARFAQATMKGALLDGITADHSDFASAVLTGASMRKAVLEYSDLRGADLAHAELAGARLAGADLRDVRLDGASLASVNLEATELKGADLTHADLSKARLAGQDLRDVKLTRARFRGARMRRCNLEGVCADSVDFFKADLRRADLTGSRLFGCYFDRADLRSARLADVQWEGADLRRADLRGASFQMGSTRCGLVGSTIPCEGSRTGFYTDEFDELEHLPPEEVRKADLRGADLRGAKIKGVDFYLVDLRGAKYTKKQEQHLRRCRAILDGR